LFLKEKFLCGFAAGIACGRNCAQTYNHLHSVSFRPSEDESHETNDAFEPQGLYELLAPGMVHKIPLQDDEKRGD
jgi:hypothetical protein